MNFFNIAYKFIIIQLIFKDNLLSCYCLKWSCLFKKQFKWLKTSVSPFICATNIKQESNFGRLFLECVTPSVLFSLIFFLFPKNASQLMIENRFPFSKQNTSISFYFKKAYLHLETLFYSIFLLFTLLIVLYCC